jgi:uncharacterized protein YjiS (DUF1127 family)
MVRVATPELRGLDVGWPARGRFGGRWPGELLRRTTDRLWVWLERARQRRQLLQLDEHLRHDLGLTQAAIDAEVAKPFWQP